MMCDRKINLNLIVVCVVITDSTASTVTFASSFAKI